MTNTSYGMAHTLTTFHLFAGAGGGILADILLGHNPVGACEIEPYPRNILLQRQLDGYLPRFPVWDDVATLDGNPWRGTVDILCGGFPCQDISAANPKGKGIKGSRSGLWKEYSRLIDEIQPAIVFAENSPLLRTRGLGTVLKDLAKLGYNARWGIMGARHVSAPHRRDRMWVLAYRHDRSFNEKHEIQTGGDTSFVCSSAEAVDHSDSLRCEGDSEMEGGVSKWIGGAGRQPHTMADPASKRLQRGRGPKKPDEEGRQIQDGQDSQCGRLWWANDPADLRAGSDVVSQDITDQPVVDRMAHGVAYRVDRLKAIGNGQVPQCAALAFRVLSHGLLPI